MESTVDFIFHAENIRMLVVVAFVVCGIMWLRFSFEKKIDSVEASIDKKIDEKLNTFHAQLKANDFAHLNNTIEALTFTLEKNGYLKREDKEYIDTRLDR